jgi:hypothetical protein
MFALSTTYTYWTLADAQVKKDEHLENQNLHPFSPIGFFTLWLLWPIVRRGAVCHSAAYQAPQ